MSRASVEFENACLAGPLGIAGTNIIPFISAHTGDTLTTGTNEVVNAIYARQSESWGTPSGGAVINTNSLAIPIPAGTTVSYVGHWSALSGGTFGFGAPLSSSVTFANSGTLTIAAGADQLAVA